MNQMSPKPKRVVPTREKLKFVPTAVKTQGDLPSGYQGTAERDGASLCWKV